MTALEKAIQKSQEVMDLVSGKFKTWDNQVKAQIAKMDAWKDNIIAELRVGRIYFENKRHCISTNDGAGNFNIRVGVTGEAEPKITEDGFGGTITFDQANGVFDFLISPETKTVGENAELAKRLSFNRTSAYFNGNKIPAITAHRVGTNGWIKLDTGLMIVNGTVTASSGQTFNFPVGFTVACLQAVANHGGTQVNPVQINIVSKTQFRVFHNNSNAINVQYIAFGV